MALDWEPAGQDLGTGQFDLIIPEEVLYELDSPMIFTFRNSGRLLLAYMCGEAPRLCRFIVAPTSRSIVERLLAGEVSVRGAIDQPWCWCIDVASDGNVSKNWITTLDELPPGVVPGNDVFLEASREPIFAVRVEGRKLRRNNVPASVIKRVVDGVYTALKKLAESSGGGGAGRPSTSNRLLFDLPTQKVALGSFEISFGEPLLEHGLLPDDGVARAHMETRGRELGAALTWAVAGRSEGLPDIPLLEAVQKLAPPSQGLVETVSVTGSMLGGSGAPYVLDRRASRKVRTALSAARDRSEQIITLKGEARELDKDKLSFRLRSADSPEDYICLFEEELYDDIMEAFASDHVIGIALRLSRGARQGKVVAVSATSDLALEL